MAVTATSFRAAFPAFTNVTTYPDAMVNFWISQAALLLDSGRWGALLDYGTMLFVAHQVTLQGIDAKTAAFGGNPGAASGPVNSKSVDKVSIGYDTTAAAEEGAGAWNLTTYGQQYIRQARIMGVGPVQIDQQVAGATGGVSLYNGAWAGPITW